MPISAIKFASSSVETTGGLQPVNDFLDVRILGMGGQGRPSPVQVETPADQHLALLP
jgi:hypothetical protein